MRQKINGDWDYMFLEMQSTTMRKVSKQSWDEWNMRHLFTGVLSKARQVGTKQGNVNWVYVKLRRENKTCQSEMESFQGSFNPSSHK